MTYADPNMMLAGMQGWGNFAPNTMQPAISQAAPVSLSSFTSPMLNSGGIPDWMQGTGTAVPGTDATGGGGFKGWIGQSNNLNALVNGIGALTSAYLGFQQLKQAKETLGLQKDAFNANLNNSIKTYNTSLEDRIRGRNSSREQTEGDIQSYLSKHSLKR